MTEAPKAPQVPKKILVDKKVYEPLVSGVFKVKNENGEVFTVNQKYYDEHDYELTKV